jgi:hypothetical protein
MALKLEKLIIGNFASFVEKGTVVGENTVDSGFYPEDEEDLDAWSSLGCVLDATPEPEVETDSDYCPDAAGGYRKEDTDNVVKDVIKMTLKCHSEPIWRMILGVKAKLVNGTPQTPFANKDRFVEGWLNIEQRAQDGVARTLMVIYGRLKIDANPSWSKDPTKPSVRFEILTSSIASVEPNAIV